MSYGLAGDINEAGLARKTFRLDVPAEQAGADAAFAAIYAAQESAPRAVADAANETLATLVKGAIVAGFLATAAFLGYKYMTRQS